MSTTPVLQSHAGQLPEDVIYLAQNTADQPEAPSVPADSSAAETAQELPPMPSMPPPKIFISTEKPVPEFPIPGAESTETAESELGQPAMEPTAESAVPSEAAQSRPEENAATETGTPAMAGDVPSSTIEQAEGTAEPGAQGNAQEMAANPVEPAGPETEAEPQGPSPLQEVIDAAESAANIPAGAAGAAVGAAETAAQSAQGAVPQQQTPTQQTPAAEQQSEQSAEQQPTEQQPAEQQEVAVLPPQTTTPEPATTPAPARPATPVVREEISLFNVPTANLRTMKVVIDDDYNLRGIVYGEEQGYLRKLDADESGNFREVWKSPPLNAPVREVFVDDIDADGKSEIVAYTNNGNMFIFSYDTTEMIYRTPEGTYDTIHCMIIANMDNDPQKELFFLATRPGMLQQDSDAGNLVQFDTVSQFDEWTSSDLYSATDMAYGNVDNDDEMEIILNSGEILSQRFKTIKWKTDVEFGSRLYLIDLDDDGILELVTEYNQSYVRIFDIDQRREKW